MGLIKTAMIVASALAFDDGGAALNAQPITVTTGMIINDVTVVNTRDGSLTPGMAIYVDNGRIRKIAKAGSILFTGTAQTVNASGKYVVPGYLDMHAHAMSSDGLAEIDLQQTFRLMIANGITGFREMAGSKELIAQGKSLNKEIEAGTMVAPELLIIPGELFNLSPRFLPPGANPPEIAARKVLEQKQYGADFIKILDVDRETFLAILDAARKQDLDVAGHLNPDVRATEASNAGMKAIEHMGPIISILLDCSTAEEMIRRKMAQQSMVPPSAPAGPPSRAMINRMIANPVMMRLSEGGERIQFVIDTYSEEKCRVLAKVFVKNGTWQVPTLIRVRTMQIFDDPIYRNDPNLKYVASETKAMWEEIAEAYEQKAPAATKATYRQLYDLQLKVVKLFNREGGKMLAGSDMTGGWCIPGFSLQQEFRELAKAGLSPLEILQMTTLNGAEFLKREATMGTVDEGKNADLVLLDANPIENVENLERISAVVLKGRYYSKAALEKMKRDVETFYEKREISCV